MTKWIVVANLLSLVVAINAQHSILFKKQKPASTPIKQPTSFKIPCAACLTQKASVPVKS